MWTGEVTLCTPVPDPLKILDCTGLSGPDRGSGQPYFLWKGSYARKKVVGKVRSFWTSQVGLLNDYLPNR